MLTSLDLHTQAGAAHFEQLLERLRATVSLTGEEAAATSEIVEDVRAHGDEAVVRYMQRWTDADFQAERIVVSPAELEEAEAKLPPDLREAIEAAIGQVRAYQEHIRPAPVEPIELGGAELGLRWRPLDSAGLCVPGGTAVLFSTLIMLAVPALAAGVEPSRLAVMNPPPTRRTDEPAGDISPLVLATCRLLGLERVYRLGGAQGVAALAHGTESVQPVDLIAGPGNVYVQLAKAQVAGTVGMEGGFYGPSEIVTIADETARPDCIAADLLAQAEHDPGKCFFITWSRQMLDRVIEQVQVQLAGCERLGAIRSALEQESAAILVRDADEAVEVANRLAGEHVNLAVAEPDTLLEGIRHAGEVFLGDGTPVAAGDYYAGPSHCLPTGTTARFGSGVSVYTFLKRTGTVAYRRGMSPEAIERIARMAEAEGLGAHATSVRVRE